ncbi:hypothetical protein B0I35DRAFT_276049 [Stachybotrys elegans]|uniref:Zn(2)-C6 fungal-type domain-containing protein n=1 Tax=Stachybotrys elegans TaxID=80388 RepID=A0A8K0SM17_9HYPO|nr:hypothetical protein B0I35DRAFT_276049 [Stachybotrys elegans]
MVGIPKTKRCQRCKHRKIKCDEKWPSCTPCFKARAQCSGPPQDHKFVHNGRHAKGGNTAFDARSSSSSTSHPTAFDLISVSVQTAPGGEAYGCYSMPSAPRPLPTTLADRVAARLIGHLDRDPFRDLLLNMSYFKYLPNRLNENVALRDCVAVFISAWANFRRRLPPDRLVDGQAYGKALRSLQRVLDGKQQLDPETLAAIIVLERSDAFFNLPNPTFHTVHARGIQTLMLKRGPPPVHGSSELDAILTLEAQVALLPLWLVEGGYNFFEEPPWHATIQRAHEIIKHLNPGFESAYELDQLYRQWPHLARELRSIYTNPDKTSGLGEAIDIRSRVVAIELRVQSIEQEIIVEGRKRGVFQEIPSPATRLGMQATFTYTKVDFAQLYLGVMMLRMVLFRMLYDLSVFVDEPDPSYIEAYEALCAKSRLSIPYARRLGPMAAMMFHAIWVVSFEGAHGADREDMLDFITETDAYRQVLPKDRADLEKHIIKTARTLIGSIGLDPEPSSKSRRVPCIARFQVHHHDKE